MPQTETRTAELLARANALPALPGVYIMKDRQGQVIYVGKSRKLKNRVSQYFQNSRKNLKTLRMISHTEDFDSILCATEIEALTLENTLIKQYSPKYNIRLKDAKSYPYIKVTHEEYPRIVYTRTRLSDKAKYYGPFSGTGTVFAVLDVLRKTLGLPNCKRKFPQEIGKERPCLYYHIKQCCGVCTGQISPEDYRILIRLATDILKGNVGETKKLLEGQMLQFADQEKFEEAARCRDAISALDRLSEKQNMVAAPGTDQDVFGLFEDELGSCISVLYIRDGAVIDKADYLLDCYTQTDSTSLSAFLTEHYRVRDDIPRNLLLSFSLEEEDSEILSEYLSQRTGRRIYVKRPERGALHTLCLTAVENASERVRRAEEENRRDESVLSSLASLLHLEVLPERIEAYDISNIGSEHKTCGMIVFENGKPKKSEYRSFSIKEVEGTDDYASMTEALRRRLIRLREDATGAFSKYPDLILLDGGKGHVSVIRGLMREMGIEIPVFGMVKDDYHKTRALCTEEDEIAIAKDRAIFGLIYRIQEEVHRFTVGRTSGAKRKTLRTSSLEKIEGIGPAKAKKLLAHFGGLGAIRKADREALMAVKGISRKDADAVFAFYHKEDLE